MSNALCGARRRNGAPCRRPAGWGTTHVGYGACKLHAGFRRHLERLAGPVLEPPREVS
jgi:hypothetical protein